MPGVNLDGVSLSFGNVDAVSDVSLAVSNGEFVTLLGPSGCGKTSTLRMIAGLQHNSAGRISIGDTLVSDPSRGIFVPPERRKLGMVFQSYAIWPHLTVFENVAYPLRVQGRSNEVAERVAAALKLVSMENYAARPAPALSGGQQQRVAIARALVAEPAVLLLDEPLSNLDAKLRTQMGEEFRVLQRRLGVTTIYVTHDQEEAMALSDRIVLMDAGRILQIGTPQELYRQPLNRSVATFFGSPNMLEGEVMECHSQNNGWVTTVVGKDWRAQCGAGQQLATGSRAFVMVRPEDLRLSEEAMQNESSDLSLSGVVTDAIFRGSRSSLRVASAGMDLNVDLPSSAAPLSGAAVNLRASRAVLWALSA